MEKNRLLKLALFVSVMIKVGAVAFAIVLTFALFVDFIPPDLRNGVSVVISEDFWGITLSESEWTDAEEVETQAPLLVTIVFYIKSLLNLAIIFLIVHQVMKVIRSLQSYHTFRNRNVAVFRIIGKLFLLFFLISIPGLGWTGSSYTLSAYFLFSPLVAALGAFILAEIFKEGNKLYEEQQLTI